MSATMATLKAPNGGPRQDDAHSESVASRRSDAASAAPADETTPSARAPRVSSDGLATVASQSGSSVLPSTSRKGPSVPALLSRRDTNGKDGKDNVSRNGSVANPPPSPAIDPLSQHIFARTNTNTERTIPSRLRSTGKPEASANEGHSRPSSDLSHKQQQQQQPQQQQQQHQQQQRPQLDYQRDKRKSISFLSRLSMIGGRKKLDDGLPDDESEPSELRTEGAHATVFSSAVEAAGFIPHHKEPPRYIRVRSHRKKVKEFNRMFLAQELTGTQPPDAARSVPGSHAPINGAPVNAVQGFGHKETKTGGPVWAVEFSRDGRFMATAGRDSVVRIWAVLATPQDRKAYDEEQATDGPQGERLSTPVFHPKPVREFVGHAGEVLDLSWSKNNFLLSSSMDKTVRLWHTSRQECLCTFRHKDFVTSIAFHPRDDRFFLAGSLDSTLRLWSIPDKAVAYSAQLTDLVTAVAFSPDGKTSIAGCLNGLCSFYETEGLTFQTQMHVRSSRGKNAKGSKITGIQTMGFPAGDADAAEVKVLVTSNDSRIRIYGLRDKQLELKFKGHENTCNQIRASFSDDGTYIVCGSEDRRAFIWSTSGELSDKQEKRPYEYFEAHSAVVTQAVLAPTATRQLLQASHDPIFTLCNPPPITLLSMEESTNEGALADGPSEAATSPLPSPLASPRSSKRPEETPAFLARAQHHDGNILVTTDHAGIIKVFRQDCAFNKRRQESWETGSSFSRKRNRNSMPGRTGSIMTRTSASSVRDPHSRRGSMSHHNGHAPGLAGLAMSPDRIISWRQGVEGGSQTGSSRPSSLVLTTPARSERSISPAKTRPSSMMAASAAHLALDARRKPYAQQHAASPTSMPAATSPPGSVTATSTPSHAQPSHPASPPASLRQQPCPRGSGSPPTSAAALPTSPTASVRTLERPMPPTPSFSLRSIDDGDDDDDDDDDALRLDAAGASYSFWNLNRWRHLGGAIRGGASSGPSSGSLERDPKAGAGEGNRVRSISEAPAPKPSLGGSPGMGDGGGDGGTLLLGPALLTTASESDETDSSSGAAAAGKPPQPRQKPPPPPPQQQQQPGLGVEERAHRRRSAPARSSSHGSGRRLAVPPMDGSRLAPPDVLCTVVRSPSPTWSLTSGGGDDAAADEDEEMRCTKCGGREFKAKKVGGRQRFLCAGCGRMVDA